MYPNLFNDDILFLNLIQNTMMVMMMMMMMMMTTTTIIGDWSRVSVDWLNKLRTLEYYLEFKLLS
jgi:hypothetical protein